MRRIYLDSNVFISLIDREIGKGSRGLFVEAEQFLERVKESSSMLVLSDWFFKEIHSFNFMKKEAVIDYFLSLGVKTETLPNEKELPVDVVRFRELHSADAFHAAIAIAAKCDCIVTFNIKDFEKVREIIPVFEPADF
jgi:predicted nucleic acid-binding protein